MYDKDFVVDFLKAVYNTKSENLYFRLGLWLDSNITAPDKLITLPLMSLYNNPELVKSSIDANLNNSYDQVLYNKSGVPTLATAITVDWDSKEIPDFVLPPSYILVSGNHYHISWFLRYPVWYKEAQMVKCGMLNKWKEIDKFSANIIHFYRLPFGRNLKSGHGMEIKFVSYNPERRYELDELAQRFGLKLFSHCTQIAYRIYEKRT